MLETITNIASVVLVQVIYFNRTCSNNVVKVVKRVMTCSRRTKNEKLKLFLSMIRSPEKQIY